MEGLIQAPPSPSATAPYKPGDDSLASPVDDDDGDDDDGRAAAAAVQQQNAAAVADTLACLQELRDEAASWVRESKAVLAGVEGMGDGAAAAGGSGSSQAIEALLARDVLRAVQVRGLGPVVWLFFLSGDGLLFRRLGGAEGGAWKDGAWNCFSLGSCCLDLIVLAP